MKPRIFIDCGFYEGGILKAYRDWGIVDKDWTIYAFEPNPEIDVQAAIAQLELPVQWIPEAVWTEDKTLTLFTSNREDAASLADTTLHHQQGEYVVNGRDFSQFLRTLPEGYVICSMDIEGAEFAVLEKLLRDKTLQRINLLDVEFHHRFMPDKETKDAEELLREIMNQGVTVRLKVPFE